MQPAWINLIFVAVRKRLIESEKSRNPSWLFDCHRSRARKIKKVATFANWLASKKGALFRLIYFFQPFSIYHIPHDYVTPQTHSFYPHRSHETPPISQLFIYRDVRELSIIVLGKALWEMACVNGETGTYGLKQILTTIPAPFPLSFQVIINESLKNTPLNAVYLRYWWGLLERTHHQQEH